MHYKNGREAKVGDVIVHQKWWNGKTIPTSGVVVSTQAGSTTCNASVVPLGTQTEMVTLSECLHADDALLSHAGQAPVQPWEDSSARPGEPPTEPSLPMQVSTVNPLINT